MISVIWNVRTMPFATRSTTVCRVMSSPSKITLPAVGGKKPLMRLKKVVLPAPFGPITARISPARISNETPSTAFRLPKWRDTFSIRRNGRSRGRVRRRRHYVIA